MRRRPCVLAIILCVGALLLMQPSAGQAQSTDPPRVLLLNAYHAGFDCTDSIVDGVRSTFDVQGADVQLTIEYLDTKRYAPESLFPELAALYKQKSKDAQPDVIIVSDNNALTFLLRYRDDVFPEVPVVFTGINYFDDSLIAGHEDITGVVEDPDIEGTLELALHLHPDTTTIAVGNAM